MAAINNARGLVEYRHMMGHVCPRTRRYRVKADAISGAAQKFAGDLVTLVSGDTVAVYGAGGSAASVTPVGVIRAVYDSNGRPFTHQLPAGGPFIPASTAGWVEVNIDPWQTYLANADATVASTHVGQFVDVTANTASTAAGRSGFSVRLAGAANTATNALPLQIIAIGDNERDSLTDTGLTGGESNQDVEVRIAVHGFGVGNVSLKVR